MPASNHTDFALENLRSIDALVAEYPDHLTEQTLRWQLRHRQTNGLGSACVKIGKRLMLSKPRYFAWLESRAEVQ